MYYIDDEDEGLARETSHPLFREIAKSEFYYDCTDDFSPFGNDSGHDVLQDLQDWYGERRAGEKAATFLRNLIARWGFDADYLSCLEQHQLEELDSEQQSINDTLDQAVISVAFGQFKIAGKADRQMQELAANAFRRQRYVAGLARKREKPWEHCDDYIARLDTMESDLTAMFNKNARS